MKRELKDATVKGLKPKAQPYELMDLLVKGFGIRVMPGGTKSFILFRRFGSSNPVRRVIGAYPEMSLEDARDKARQWNVMVKAGLDPAVEIERERQKELEAEKRRQTDTFGVAFEAYLKRKASKLRSGPDIEREMRREFRDWMDKPLSDITQRDVKDAIQKIIDRGAETSAHTLFAMARGFFNWCVDSGDFGIETSPCAKIKPTVLIGDRNIRSRVLKDYEIGVLWRAAGLLDFPFGPLVQLLLLTALRRGEASDVTWSEIDLDAKLWTIPAERMKGGAAHIVPLTPDIITLLEGLPRFRGGDFVFSTTGGRRPVAGFSKAKTRLDKLMAADLEAQGKQFEDFIIHDIRRTCRTRFSALPVEDIVRELLLAHARPGLHKIYDLHLYEQEKRHGLELWHEKLRTIVEPVPAGNVIRLAANA
jgi:integrase